MKKYFNVMFCLLKYILDIFYFVEYDSKIQILI